MDFVKIFDSNNIEQAALYYLSVLDILIDLIDVILDEVSDFCDNNVLFFSKEIRMKSENSTAVKPKI